MSLEARKINRDLAPFEQEAKGAQGKSADVIPFRSREELKEMHFNARRAAEVIIGLHITHDISKIQEQKLEEAIDAHHALGFTDDDYLTWREKNLRRLLPDE